ncbi:MAG: ATP synthase subunit I [Oscillospiraceae bacterium]|nr:ATP synthase subunit I [Oscillospiraceae bacterium]
MKLQAASRREVSRIAIGTLACDAIMIAGLFLLSQFEIGTFDFIKIILGTIPGSLIAIINFAILCLTVQSAVNIENQRKMKARFQTSYNLRLTIQAIWIVAAFLLRSKIHFLAAAAPIFFPKITILYLQFKGKLMPKDEPQAAAAEETASNEESN